MRPTKHLRSLDCIEWITTFWPKAPQVFASRVGHSQSVPPSYSGRMERLISKKIAELGQPVDPPQSSRGPRETPSSAP